VASYPTSVKSFTTKATNDVVQASHVNDLQDEVTAVQTGLLTSLDHHVALAATRRLTFAGTTTTGTTGPSILSGASGFDVAANSVGFRIVNSAYSTAFLTIADSGATAIWAGITSMLVGATTFEIQNGENHSGILTTSQIVANTNNWNPGTGGKRVLRASSDASRNVTGLVAVSNQRLTLINGGAQNIVLIHESASSTDVNRFLCPGGGDFTLNTLDSVELWYDSVSTRWRVLAF
jgi:hypothetical protein